MPPAAHTETQLPNKGSPGERRLGLPQIPAAGSQLELQLQARLHQPQPTPTAATETVMV